MPVRIGEYIYYRKFENPADALTIYRFPIEELEKRNFSEGEVPYERFKENNDIQKPESFPEEAIFSLADLNLLYKHYSLKDESIKTFIESLSSII